MATGTIDSTIRAAQAAVVNGTDVLAGPDLDTITTGERQDGTHFDTYGADSASTLWKNALDGNI